MAGIHFSTVRECAKLFGLSQAELTRWIKAGWVRAKKDGHFKQGRLSIRADDIETVISQLGSGRTPKIHRHTCAVISWDKALGALVVEYPDLHSTSASRQNNSSGRA